jgi:hypothetical protein
LPLAGANGFPSEQLGEFDEFAQGGKFGLRVVIDDERSATLAPRGPSFLSFFHGCLFSQGESGIHSVSINWSNLVGKVNRIIHAGLFRRAPRQPFLSKGEKPCV